MLFSKQKTAIDQLTADKRAWQKVGVFSTLTAFFLGAMLLVIGKGTEKTILVPPVVTKTFWVDGSQVAPEYIEQMSVYFAQLALNGNPANVLYQHNTLLQHVTPSAHGALKAELGVAADKLQRDNASQAFYPYEVTVRKNTAKMLGRLVTTVGDKVTSNRDVAYEIEFTYEGGRLYVSSFKEAANARAPASE